MTDLERQLPQEVLEAVQRANNATSRVERLKRIGILYTAAAVTVIGILIVVQTFTSSNTLDAVRSTQLESSARGVDIKASSANSEKILRTLQDCLTPKGKCYERGQANQRRAVSHLGVIYTYAGLCLQNPAVDHNAQAQTACVSRLIERYGLMEPNADSGSPPEPRP